MKRLAILAAAVLITIFPVFASADITVEESHPYSWSVNIPGCDFQKMAENLLYISGKTESGKTFYEVSFRFSETNAYHILKTTECVAKFTEKNSFRYHGTNRNFSPQYKVELAWFTNAEIHAYIPGMPFRTESRLFFDGAVVLNTFDIPEKVLENIHQTGLVELEGKIDVVKIVLGRSEQKGTVMYFPGLNPVRVDDLNDISEIIFVIKPSVINGYQMPK